MQTALLLIDVQQSFAARPYWSETDLPDFIKRTNALLQGAAQRGIPVVQVFHVDGPASADNPFSIPPSCTRADTEKASTFLPNVSSSEPARRNGASARRAISANRAPSIWCIRLRTSDCR